MKQKIDLVGRMGGNWYCRAHGDALFEVEKPLTTVGIGFDNIPEDIKNSKILTGNDLGILGGVEKLPSAEECAEYVKNNPVKGDKHTEAKRLLSENKVEEAWKVLLSK